MYLYWVITDARHDSTSNAHHSTVPCLALVWLEGMHMNARVYQHANRIVHFSTHRIVGIATLSRQDHRVAQTREVACTKIVLPQVIARGLLLCPNSLQFHIYFHSNEGLNITEVAHDYQSTIKQYVEGLEVVNSYDTWHGMVSICFQCVLLELVQA